MPKILRFPAPREHCRITLFARTVKSGYRFALTKQTSSDPVVTFYDLALHDLVTLLRSLELDPSEMMTAVDAMLDGIPFHFIEVQLTTAQLNALAKKRH